MTGNLFTHLQRRFAARADDTAIEEREGTVFSFGDVACQSARVANALIGLGLHPGDRVAVQVDKSPHALFLYLGCLRAGLVFLPLNTAYQPREIDYFLGDATPGVIVCSGARTAWMLETARQQGVPHVLTLEADGTGTLAEICNATSDKQTVHPCGGDDLAAILYTSGTTGRPKGAMISHKNLTANCLSLHDAWGWRDGDILLHVLPIFHVHGLFVACHCALYNASKMYFFDTADSDVIIDYLPRSTVFMGVPTHYTRLLDNPRLTPETCRGMRLFISGSAPLLEQTFYDFRKRTGHTILERYGMTETGMNTSNPLNGERIAGTVGKALPGVKLRIVDEDGLPVTRGDVGALLVKGDNVFSGYWRMPEKTDEEFTADGYFATGDLARETENGYITIVGRDKDLIISGGYNVYPKEVELCIDEIPGVRESAVIGVPHPDFGEAVTAIVVRDPDGRDVDEQRIVDDLRNSLAKFKLPKTIHFVDELPRNAMGKVQKNLLRQRYESAR